jgi:hypothetical protein
MSEPKNEPDSTPEEERPKLTLLPNGVQPTRDKSANEIMMDGMLTYPCEPHPDLLERGVRKLPFTHSGARIMLGAITSAHVCIEYIECNTIGEREDAIEYLEDLLRRVDPETGTTTLSVAR